MECSVRGWLFWCRDHACLTTDTSEQKKWWTHVMARQSCHISVHGDLTFDRFQYRKRLLTYMLKSGPHNFRWTKCIAAIILWISQVDTTHSFLKNKELKIQCNIEFLIYRINNLLYPSWQDLPDKQWKYYATSPLPKQKGVILCNSWIVC